MASAARAVLIPTDLAGLESIHLIPRSEIQVVTKTQFEELVEKLGLQDESMIQLASARSYQHIQLRLWCRKHVHTRYVPTFLIEAWGIDDWSYDR